MEKELQIIFQELCENLTKEQLDNFRDCKKEEFMYYHFGLGTYIRNQYLWSKQRIYFLFVKEGITHPDDMSSFILEKFYQYLNRAQIPSK